MAKQLARYDNYHSLATISANGTQVLVLFKQGLNNYPTVININTGKEIARLDDYFVPDAMSLSPDGRYAVLAQTRLRGEPRDPDYAYQIILWDVIKTNLSPYRQILRFMTFYGSTIRNLLRSPVQA